MVEVAAPDEDGTNDALAAKVAGPGLTPTAVAAAADEDGGNFNPAIRAAFTSSLSIRLRSSSAIVTARAAFSSINPGCTPDTALIDDGTWVEPGAIPAYNI